MSVPLCFYGENGLHLGSGLDSGFASSFLRIRRSSIKFSALTVHSTDANMIITLVSIEGGSSPADHCISDLWQDARLIRRLGCEVSA
jgi:hypothetical protein